MIHLALDLGTRTGIAIADERVVLDLTHWDLDKPAGSSHRRKFRGFRDRLKRKLHEIAGRDPEIVIFYEKALGHYPGSTAAQIWGAWWGILECLAGDYGLETYAFPAATIKKAAAGHGRTDKDGVRQMMRNFGYRPDTDDEADALAILYTGLVHTESPSRAKLFKVG